MPDEKEPVVITVSDFDLLTAEDEDQILADLRGIPTDKFIYDAPSGPQLSYAGTKWAVRKMAEAGEAIRIDGHPEVKLCPQDPEHIVVTVLAKRVRVDRDSGREVVLDSTVGSSRGWIKQKKRDNSIAPDEHFFAKTVSKATRNAQQALIPPDFVKKLIEELVTGGKRRKTQQQPPPQAAKTEAANPEPAKQAETRKQEPPKADDAGAARQKLMAIFKVAISADTAECRKYLMAWTGKEKTHDLDVKTLTSLTSALHKVREGTASYDELGILDKTTGAVLAGKPKPAAASTQAGSETNKDWDF